MARGETVKEIRARMIYEVDQASVQRLMSANARARKDLTELIESWPKNMRKAAMAAFNEFVQGRKKQEAFEKAEARKAEAEQKRRDRTEAKMVADKINAEIDQEQRLFTARVRLREKYMADLVRAHQRERAENERNIRTQEREEAESLRRREAERERNRFRVGGFAGMAGGGGFGGLTFSGKGAGLATAAVGLAQWGISKADDYRESDLAVHRMMTLVNGAERAMGNDFQHMRAEAAKLATELGITIPQAADAMREALTNDISPENAPQFVKGANRLAMMEGNDLNTTITSIASIRNAYSLSEKQMQEVPDILFAAMDRGNVKMRDLANQIGQLSGVANQAGITLKPLMATLANVTLKGMNADVAATALRNLSQKLASPTDKMIEAQNKIGLRLTPEVLERDFVGAMNKFHELAVAKGIDPGKGVGADFRMSKILPYIWGDKGAGINQAMEDQNAAIRDHRASQGGDEMLDTEAKKWASVKEQMSQAGQAFGSIASRVEIFVAKMFMGGSIPGQKTAGGRDIRQLVDSGDAGRFGGFWESGGSEARAGMADRWLTSKSKEYGQTFNSINEVEDYERRKKMADANGQRMAAPNGQSEEDYKNTLALNEKLAEMQTKMNEAIQEKARNEELADRDERKQFEEKIKRIGKLKAEYLGVGRAKLAALGVEMEGARGAYNHWTDAVQKSTMQAFDVTWAGGDKEIDRLGKYSKSTANQRALALGARGAEASRLVGTFGGANPEEAARQGHRAIGAYSELQGMDLLSIGRKGQMPYKDVQMYADQVVDQEGLKGNAARARRKEIEAQARSFATDVSKSYSAFHGVRGHSDADFTRFYTDSKMRGVEHAQEKSEWSEVAKQEKEQAKSKALMLDIETAYEKQKSAQEKMIESFKELEGMADTFSETIKGAVSAVDGLFSRIEADRAAQAGLKDAASFNPALRDLKSDNEDPLSFANPGVPGGAKSVHVTNNTGDTVLNVQLAPGTTEAQAREIVEAVRTAQDRGTGTIKSSK